MQCYWKPFNVIEDIHKVESKVGGGFLTNWLIFKGHKLLISFPSNSVNLIPRSMDLFQCPRQQEAQVGLAEEAAPGGEEPRQVPEQCRECRGLGLGHGSGLTWVHIRQNKNDFKFKNEPKL